MAAAIFVWGYSYKESLREAYVPVEHINEHISIPSEEGVFLRSEYALEYEQMPIDIAHERNLNKYYKNRAFYGGPPTIPHEVSERSMGNKDCLKCHEHGGYVQKFNAYSPVTPHPEKINCRQCHVPQKTEQLFVASTWDKGVHPKIGNQALENSPPIIPHPIQLRENCMACHAGPSAPKEIRTTHPQRINCRQCHVINDKEQKDIGVFTRKSN